jgi:hypothetical protein
MELFQNFQFRIKAKISPQPQFHPAVSFAKQSKESRIFNELRSFHGVWYNKKRDYIFCSVKDIIESKRRRRACRGGVTPPLRSLALSPFVAVAMMNGEGTKGEGGAGLPQPFPQGSFD